MKRILVSAIIAAASINAYAESNVTLYGVIDQAVAVTKHKHEAAKVRIDDGTTPEAVSVLKEPKTSATATPSDLSWNKAFTPSQVMPLSKVKPSAVSPCFKLKANGAKSPSAEPAVFLQTAEHIPSFTAQLFGLHTIQTAT